jgi:hypothetical protein
MLTDTAIILGFKLDTTVLMIKVVSDKLGCVMECHNEACCRSINYKKTSTFQNEPNCEILHHVVYNSSENALMKSSSFDHVYLVDSEKVRRVWRYSKFFTDRKPELVFPLFCP